MAQSEMNPGSSRDEMIMPDVEKCREPCLLPCRFITYVNQIIAAAVLFGIVTVVFAPLIVESGSQIFSRSSSISDIMDRSRHQTGQTIVATHIQHTQDNITIFLSNIGIEDVKIHTVLIDGIDSTHILKDQYSVQTNILATEEMGVLEVEGAGDSVQIVSTTGKLFEFATP